MSVEKIRAVSEKIQERLPAVRGKGEEATKQALILPMLDALGYDIWNPSEVCPEFEADFALKKKGQAEKVDFAILIDGTPRIFVEAKAVDSSLDGHEGQLARYFNAVPSVALAILTNGLEYRFFTDTGDPNVMDSAPFHVVKLDAPDTDLEVMARFGRAVFAAEPIRDFATELTYTAKIAAFLRSELDLRDRDASENLVRWILGSAGMYEGRVTANVVDRFRPIVKNGLQRVIVEIVRRSVAAIDNEVSKPDAAAIQDAASAVAVRQAAETAGRVDPDPSETGRKVVTTERELEFFAIAREQFAGSPLASATIWDTSTRREVPAEVGYKDTTGYFAIYLNKPAFWALRVLSEGRTPWVGFNLKREVGLPLVPAEFKVLEPSAFAEFRVAVSGPGDLRALDRLVHLAFAQTVEEHRPKADGLEVATPSCSAPAVDHQA
ncbi:MAG TPA: hypothetical protein DFS52_14525 [Myxococcales bacterium]|jgi:hypothetical protein|nr:hypothetical protein [Myxococcales bacterium]